MTKLLTSNEWQWRLARTIVQGVLGVVVANIDTPNPGVTGYHEALYRVHWLPDPPAWGKYEHDDDGGVGNDRDQIDLIELTIAPC